MSEEIGGVSNGFGIGSEQMENELFLDIGLLVIHA